MEEQVTGDKNLQIQKEAELQSLELISLHSEYGLQRFSKVLEESKGKALVLIHPFYPEHPSSRFQPDIAYTHPYLTKLKHTVAKALEMKNRNLPILIMAESYDPKATSLKNQQNVEQTREKLGQLVRGHFGIQSGDIFFLITRFGGPDPLTDDSPPEVWAKDQEKRRDNLSSFARKIHSIGLQRVVIGGTKLTTRTRVVPKENGLAKETIHEGCVTATIEAFENTGIKVGISSLTYPEIVEKRD